MKALIVGLGGVGQRHARNLRFILPKDLELIAYRTRRLTRVITPTLKLDPGRNVESDLGIRVFTDLGEALAERPDVAFICNPNSMHVEAARLCLSGGCDVFIEKPLSDRFEGVEELVHAVELAQRIVMVGYQLRFHPCVRTLASLLESGVLGEVVAVRATIGEFLPGFHPYEDYRELYAAKANLGGGVVLTQIHEIDYLHALFGPITSVYALGGHWSHLDIDVEDVASTLMEASFRNRPLPIHLHQDFLQVPAVRQCEIVGERGRVVADFHSLTVTLSTHEGEPTVHSFVGFDRNQMFIDELRHFLHCVEARTRPIVDLHDGLQSLRIALAVKQSMASRGVVHLEQNVPVSMHMP